MANFEHYITIYNQFYRADNNEIRSKTSIAYIYIRFILLTEICVILIQIVLIQKDLKLLAWLFQLKSASHRPLKDLQIYIHFIILSLNFQVLIKFEVIIIHTCETSYSNVRTTFWAHILISWKVWDQNFFSAATFHNLCFWAQGAFNNHGTLGGGALNFS